MDIAIQDARDNPLLEREEYELRIDHEGDATPSVSKVRKKFAAENDHDPDTIEVDHIYTRHGGNISTAFIKAYENKIVVEDDADDEPEDEGAEESDEADEKQDDGDE